MLGRLSMLPLGVELAHRATAAVLTALQNSIAVSWFAGPAAVRVTCCAAFQACRLPSRFELAEGGTSAVLEILSKFSTALLLWINSAKPHCCQLGTGWLLLVS